MDEARLTSGAWHRLLREGRYSARGRGSRSSVKMEELRKSPEPEENTSYLFLIGGGGGPTETASSKRIKERRDRGKIGPHQSAHTRCRVHVTRTPARALKTRRERTAAGGGRRIRLGNAEQGKKMRKKKESYAAVATSEKPRS